MPIYPPPPPIDYRGVTRHGGFYDSTLWLCVISLLIIVGISSFVIERMLDAGHEHRAFMSKCIEFNHVDRCLELDRWGRQDLFDRKDYK